MDFVNVGTNDLTQYLLAVDRNNKKVARYFNGLHPSVIATVDQIVSVCRKAGKQVCICGEAAAVNESIFLFIAMGADHSAWCPRRSLRPSSLSAIRKKDAGECACRLSGNGRDAREIAAYSKICYPYRQPGTAAELT
ncbi:MAG: putative PEP-binding protein [Desulfobacterales bacterium]